MARIEEKSTKAKSIASKVLLWASVGFLAAVLVAAIVILILWIVDKNKEDEENEFVEIYTTAEIITLDDLDLMLDNDQFSPIIDKHGKIYVYIYSSTDHNSEDDTETAAEKHQANVNKCVEKYNALKATDNSVAFYVINVAHEDNEDSSLLSQYSSGVTLLVFDEEGNKTVSNVYSGLNDAINDLTPAQ